MALSFPPMRRKQPQTAPTSHRSVRHPGLVIAAGRCAQPTLQHVPGRPICQVGASQVRLMRLLPRLAHRATDRRLLHRPMQPAVPFRRHFARLRQALVDDPAALALLSLGALVAIVAIAELGGADLLATEPSEEPRAEGRSESQTSCRVKIFKPPRTISARPPAGKLTWSRTRPANP